MLLDPDHITEMWGLFRIDYVSYIDTTKNLRLNTEKPLHNKASTHPMDSSTWYLFVLKPGSLIFTYFLVIIRWQTTQKPPLR